MKQYRCGLIARDIHNSITPSVYEVYARDIVMEIDFSLFNIEPEQLKGQVDFCRAHLDGFNVTMPYKQKLLEFVDEADDSALKCGSTNTVLVREGRLIAYNTDGWGLMKALELFGVAIEGKRVVMLGAGGVALSIAYQLGLHGVKQVSVVNLFLDQAQSLCERFGQRFAPVPYTAEDLCRCCRDADLFINASVVGQVGYDDFVSLEFLKELRPGAAVYDVNYSNPDARLVPAARALGLPAWIGKPMNACQGVRAFEIWFGRTPSDHCVRELIDRLQSGTTV